MSDLEMTTEAETKEYTDELSDEALDREGGDKASSVSFFSSPTRCGGCRSDGPSRLQPRN